VCFSTGLSGQEAKGSLRSFSTGSSHEPVLKELRLTRGRCETYSTGLWLKPVLKVALLHPFAPVCGMDRR
jgi:hypothetical protein